MTLDANGTPVLPGYFRYCLMAGLLIAIYQMYQVILQFIENPEAPILIPPSFLDGILIVLIALFLSFIFLRVWDWLGKVGLPRADEVH